MSAGTEPARSSGAQAAAVQTPTSPTPTALVQQALAALGEPNRFRIVELLAERPYSVGELADALGALQPQTTKHLQALEAANLVDVRRLGRRRVAGLRRDTVGILARHFHGLAVPAADDAALAEYERAVEREQGGPSDDRTLHFTRTLDASAQDVLEAWTDADVASQWWAPRHFTVLRHEWPRRVGGPIAIALGEGGGTEYRSQGELLSRTAEGMTFELAPLGPDGEPLFSARHLVTVSGDGPTTLGLTIEVTGIRPGAAPAVAGLEPGWSQLLDQLQDLLRRRAVG
ncbi:metalloregulator ArsR/SmtB family transcription factor [Arthrobacter sp.]|uniref:metalloregulator ArsR/SmtB family transcription factor n=1 Tax=Arthrobacter sp. TaxID=1667 RepID=UPI002588E822|nr:metalloregulator ArsR/SmtB family transcription factor [Arthrobacter sp.]